MQTSTAGYHVSTMPGAGPRSFSVTMCPDCNGAVPDVARFLREANAAVLSRRVFTRPGTPLQDLARFCGSSPVTRLDGNGLCTTGATHIQLEAISGTDVRPLECGGRSIGAVYEDSGVTFCVIGDLRPRDLSAPRCEQARSIFEQLEAALAAAGMTVEHIVRTWFFVDRILDWYSEFNAVRSSMFDKWALFDRVLPASTGIGAANGAGAALVADAIAIKSSDRSVEVIDVPSPLQCPAMEYKSSFSRAVEVSLPALRRLFVSGTASIAPGGQTVHTGDLDRQIALTMDVVREILHSRGMGWTDVTRGVAYFRQVCKMGAFERYCREHEMPELPLAIASADICRDDLLFEIEVDAAVCGAASKTLWRAGS